MSEISNRIKLIRGSSKIKLSQQGFANALDVARSYVGNIELGLQEPSFAFLKKITAIYNVNPTWVVTGQGSMFIPKEENDIEHPGYGATVSAESLSNSTIAKIENGIFCSKSTVYVPVSSVTACCGTGITIYPQDYDLAETIAVNRREVGRLAEGFPPFAVYTQGHSMEGYGIKDGSVVIVNPAEEWTSGTVVMVAIDEKAAIKKVYVRENGIDLVSSAGDRLHITEEELQEGDYVRICGKVMLVIAPPEHGV